MKCFFIYLFMCVSIQLSAQQVIANKKNIQNILQVDHNCAIKIYEISTWFNPTIRTVGLKPVSYKSNFGTRYTSYEPNYITINERCITISYYVEKDYSGSSYKRLLLIPTSLLKKKNFKEEDRVYYEDSWAGKGPHFDRQGGSYKADKTIKNIISNLKYSSK